MDEDRKEWIEFQRNAMETVRRGSAPDSAGTRPWFQLLVLPSFEPATGWEVFQRSSQSKPDSFYGTRMIWRRDIDGEKFRNPVERLRYPRTLHPTIETDVFKLLPTVVELILNRFKSVSIPPYVGRGSLGLDGTTYEISLERGFVGARYHWWNGGPSQWKPLVDAALATLKELNSAADSASSSNGSLLCR